jgi:hypothetical protein
MPRPGSCCSTCTAPPASSSASRAWRSTTRSSSAGRRRSGIRCPSWWPRPWPTSRRAAAVRACPAGDVGWVCPRQLDIEAVARLRSQTCRCRCPGSSTGASCAASTPRRRCSCPRCSAVGRPGAGNALDGRRPPVCRAAGAAPTGVRDADPAFWLTRLDALRLANRADQFDEAAIDYCVTYEVSRRRRGSRRAARCTSAAPACHTRAADVSVVSDMSTGFMESSLSTTKPAASRWPTSSSRASSWATSAPR